MSMMPVTAQTGIAVMVGIIIGHSLILMGQRRWFSLDPLNAFWAGALVVYVLQPIEYWRVFLAWQGPATVVATAWWVTLAVLMVAIGYSTSIGVQLGRAIPKPPARLHPNRLFIGSLMLIGLGLGGYAYQVASAGGLRAWAAVARGGTDWAGVSVYIANLADLVPLGAGLALFHVELHSVPRYRRYLAWILSAIIWFWFLYLGSRSRIISQSLMMLAAYYLPRRRQPRLILLAVGFFAILLVVNFQAAYRNQFKDFSLNLSTLNWEDAQYDVIPVLGGGPSSADDSSVSRGIEYNCVMTAVALVPATVPYNYGYPFLEILTRWIPRAFWPNKLYPGLEAVFPILYKGGLSDTWVKTSKRPLLMGPAFTFVGYYWALGGPLALILAGLLTGVMFRAMRTLYDRNPCSEGDTIIYANIIICGFVEAAATPLSWVYSLPFTLIPLLLLFRFCRRPPARAITGSAWRSAAKGAATADLRTAWLAGGPSRSASRPGRGFVGRKES